MKGIPYMCYFIDRYGYLIKAIIIGLIIGGSFIAAYYLRCAAITLDAVSKSVSTEELNSTEEKIWDNIESSLPSGYDVSQIHPDKYLITDPYFSPPPIDTSYLYRP